MANRKKQKGDRWERDAVKKLTDIIPESKWKKMPTSGAMGTILKEPLLGGDIAGSAEFLTRTVRAECKVGYGGEKQMTIKREWFTKIREEADRTFSIPVVLLKFSGARGESKHIAAVDFETLEYLANWAYGLYVTNVQLLDEIEELKNDKR